MMDAPAPGPNADGLLLRAADFLVESSLWVSLQIVVLGAWISLAARGTIDGLGLAALFLFSFQIYTLDRMMGHPEDCVAPAERPAPAEFVGRHKRAFRKALVASAAIELMILTIKPMLLVSIAFSAGATAFYMVRVPWIGMRLKEVPFCKNVYAPGVLMAIICAFSGVVPSRQDAPVLGAAFLLLQIDIVTFDMKDVENDRRAGLRLISTVLPPRAVYALLVVSALVCAGLFSVFIPAPWNVGVVAGFLSAALCVRRLARRFSRRFLFFWGDAVTAVPLLVTLAIRGIF
jgi:4-hydroxybenzoate polyprenyltransferase